MNFIEIKHDEYLVIIKSSFWGEEFGAKEQNINKSINVSVSVLVLCVHQ